MNVKPTLKLLEGCTEVSCSSRSHKEVRTEGTPGSLADRLLVNEEPGEESPALKVLLINTCSRQPLLATLFGLRSKLFAAILVTGSQPEKPGHPWKGSVLILYTKP